VSLYNRQIILHDVGLSFLVLSNFRIFCALTSMFSKFRSRDVLLLHVYWKLWSAVLSLF